MGVTTTPQEEEPPASYRHSSGQGPYAALWSGEKKKGERRVERLARALQSAHCCFKVPQ